MTRRRAIRLALLAALCLLPGAVTTVGVAWFCAWLGRAQWAPVHVQSQAGVTEWNTASHALGGRRVLHVDARSTRATFRTETTVGWPLASLRSVRDTDPAESPFNRKRWRFLSWQEGIALPWFTDPSDDGLPMQPIVPGFTFDTALYAAAWWLLIFTPFPLCRFGLRCFRTSTGLWRSMRLQPCKVTRRRLTGMWLRARTQSAIARRLIRFASLTAICLLLGAASTVAVAWGSRWAFKPSLTPVQGELRWPVELGGLNWRRVPDAMRSGSAFGTWDTIAEARGGFDHRYGRVWVERSGWPWSALQSTRYWRDQLPGRDQVEWEWVSMQAGWKRPDAQSRPAEGFWLPAQPIWTGFAADTALFAAAFATGPAILLARRARRGSCLACGYDRSGLAPDSVCPECGKNTGAAP